MSARAVMVLGTTSGAGKSWLATALCRWYARQGLKVAPFKAQNMSNNARVVPGLDGRPGEIGSAQYFQALAAGVVPDVRMNPVLLKPEKDTASQVVVMGQVRDDFKAVPWRERSDLLWPYARQALNELMSEHDLVVIEGAGSPAEINLHASDYVNMRTALHAHAACLLVSDIDRGGAFAHLYGTFELLPPLERSRIKGFVLNRFRGDASLLSPGPDMLQRLTGVPTVGVVPLWREHGLPEEDGVFDDQATGGPGSGLRVAVVAYPRISNLDEFQPLRASRDVRLHWAREPRDLTGVDWIILPGSKHTSADLQWLFDQGLAEPIRAHARAGRPVLGICGGLQMLGQRLIDPHGVDRGAGVHTEADGSQRGLGLLDLDTHFEHDKLLRNTQARFGPMPHAPRPWGCWAGLTVHGYEIHHGRTRPSAAASDTASATQVQSQALQPVLFDGQGQCLGWRQGAVMGLYLHGLLECEPALQALLGQGVVGLDTVFDGLADHVDRHFEPGSLMTLLQQAAP